MRVATLNVQNLRLRKKDGEFRLHGAWDGDSPEGDALDPIDRRLTAELLAELDADVIALQEVFDLDTLNYFHQEFLLPTGTAPYPYRLCIPGNDGRGLDVAVMSRLSVEAVQSHASLTPAELRVEVPEGVAPDLPIFRRDCLMVRLGALTLFVCHFKSPYPNAEKAWTTRRLEALATRKLIERRFQDPQQDIWLILGDLNEPRASEKVKERATQPLVEDFSVDLMQRVPEAERWTYFDAHSGLYHCPDAMLASPALARQYPEARPFIIRKGLGREASRFAGSRLSRVGRHRPHASDHAAVKIDFPDL
ncbi:MAG: endonuclease/exonuclease/phosphatase family protein [Sulfitobacter sp.]|nr:endonuclease/exonuclease/phosphatase family protein [Sulfitobacter sp.]